jgi:hypothetical protein
VELFPGRPLRGCLEGAGGTAFNEFSDYALYATPKPSGAVLDAALNWSAARYRPVRTTSVG